MNKNPFSFFLNDNKKTGYNKPKTEFSEKDNRKDRHEYETTISINEFSGVCRYVKPV